MSGRRTSVPHCVANANSRRQSRIRRLRWRYRRPKLPNMQLRPSRQQCPPIASSSIEAEDQRRRSPHFARRRSPSVISLRQFFPDSRSPRRQQKTLLRRTRWQLSARPLARRFVEAGRRWLVASAPPLERLAARPPHCGVSSRRAGSLHAPGTRRLWYVTPALVLSVGGGLVVGIPRAKAWLTAEAAVGVADLQSIPDGAEVFLGEERIGVTPVSARLPAGKHEIEFHYAGVTNTATVDVKPNQHVEVRVDWKRQPAGRLSVTSDPEGAAVTIDGMKRGFTPLTIDDLFPGQHMVTLKHANGLVQRTVRVKANETETLDVTIYSGWLALFAPIELQVSENGKPLRLNEQNQIMLSPGRHEVQLTNRALGYRESQIVEVRPGEVTAVSMTVPKTPVTVTATPSAEVWLDGVKIGETPTR